MTTKITGRDNPCHTDRQTLDDIADALANAQADVEFLQRLRDAEALVIELTAKHDAAAAEIAIQDAIKAKAASDARFATLSGITVTDTTPTEHVLGSTFGINYTRLAWNMYANASLPAEHTIVGFQALDPVVLDYLITCHPSQVPAKIRALAPSLHAAFERYFIGLQRGHLVQSGHDGKPA